MTTTGEDSTLKVWFDDYHYVVASSPEDATRVMMETSGMDAEDFPVDEWGPLADDLIMRMEGDAPYGKTCRKWCEDNGRGYLGSID